jgi:hypothetical protein
METELPTKVMLGQTLVLMQMTFLNNVRKVGRLVLSRTSCYVRICLCLLFESVNQMKHNIFSFSEIINKNIYTISKIKIVN